MKVYISSTYRDLGPHRAAVDRTLRRMGHDVIGMEQYVAEGSRPVERCRKDVETADVYVLVLAWRYGYVPVADNSDGHSVTEIEYRHARECGTHILAFLLDPEAPWPPSQMDSASADSRAAQGISALRSEVGSENLVGTFSSPDDLASHVAGAVASFGLTAQLSQLVLNRTSVTAEDMGGFGTGIAVADSSLGMIRQMVDNVGTDRALVVRLGEGDTWWSTRLFLLASLLRSLTQVRQVVFTGRGGHFAGMASPDALMAGLAARFPPLATVRALLLGAEESQDRVTETDRQIAVWDDVFSISGGRARPAARGAGGAGARTAGRAAPPPTFEHDVKVGVREELLLGWLGERIITRCVEVGGDLTMPQVQQIVDCLLPDVPLEVAHRPDQPTGSDPPSGASPLPPPTIKVIDRDAFAFELAREWVRAGLPRSPAR